MRWRGSLVIGLMVVGCDPVVSTGGTEDGSSGGTPETTTTSDPTTPSTGSSTSGVDPSTTTFAPGTSSSSGEDGSSSSSSTGEYGTSSSSGFVGTTGSTGTGGGSSGSSTGGVIFIDPTVGDPNECDPYEQDCPDGEKCNAWADDGSDNWNAIGCFPLDPAPAQVGEICMVENSVASGIDSCDIGSMCWDVDEDTLEGVCIAMCQGTALMPTCDDPATTCVISNGGSLNLCLPGCDPLLQDCPGGQACYPVNDDFVCAPEAGDAGAAGDQCNFINACLAGNFCIAPDSYGPSCFGVGCCSPACDTAEVPVCPEIGQECLPWYDEGAAPPGYENVGVCSVPA